MSEIGPELPLGERLKLVDPATYLSRDAKFPVKSLAQRVVSSKHSLQKVLRKERSEQFPRNVREISERYAAFVNIDEILGDTTTPHPLDWSEISLSEGRGVENVHEIIEAIAHDDIEIVGSGDQLGAIHVDGAYFLTGGRHRIAALKALQVPYVPMWVIDAEGERQPNTEKASPQKRFSFNPFRRR